MNDDTRDGQRMAEPTEEPVQSCIRCGCDLRGRPSEMDWCPECGRLDEWTEPRWSEAETPRLQVAPLLMCGGIVGCYVAGLASFLSENYWVVAVLGVLVGIAGFALFWARAPWKRSSLTPLAKFLLGAALLLGGLAAVFGLAIHWSNRLAREFGTPDWIEGFLSAAVVAVAMLVYVLATHLCFRWWFRTFEEVMAVQSAHAEGDR